MFRVKAEMSIGPITGYGPIIFQPVLCVLTFEHKGDSFCLLAGSIGLFKRNGSISFQILIRAA